jgi:hypothetical protein
LTAPKKRTSKAKLTNASQPRSSTAIDAMSRARAYLKKCQPAVQESNGSCQLMATLRLIFDRFDLDGDQFRQIAFEYSATCIPP